MPTADFVGYSVDVLSITLQRRGGATVEVLPAATRIDFAQLTELADLLAVATLASGDIVGGKIRLDYSNAEVFVQSGGQVVKAKVVGADGAAARRQGPRDSAPRPRALGHHARPRRDALARLRSRRFARRRPRPNPRRSSKRGRTSSRRSTLSPKKSALRGPLVPSTRPAAPIPSTFDRGSAATERTAASPSTRTRRRRSRSTAAFDGRRRVSSARHEARGHDDCGVRHALASRPPVHGRDRSRRRQRQRRARRRRTGQHRLAQRQSPDGQSAFAVNRDHVMRVHRTVLVDIGASTKVLKTGSLGPARRERAVRGPADRGVRYVDRAPRPTRRRQPSTRPTVASGMMPTNLRGAVNSAVPGSST